MSALPVSTEDVRFIEWRRAVAALIARRYRVTLAELPGLPVVAGFESGDTPAEFVAGCAIDLDEALDVSTDMETLAWRTGHQPSWPPPG